MNLWFITALAVLLLPIWVRLYTKQIQNRLTVTLGLTLIGFMLVGCFSDSAEEDPGGRQNAQAPEESVKLRPVNSERAPIVEFTDGYVGSSRCQKCHADEHASWDESFHQSMTQLPSEKTVLGDFNDVDLQLDGANYHLKHDEHGYWVETNLGDGPSPRFVSTQYPCSSCLR